MNKLNNIVFTNIYPSLDLHGFDRESARVCIDDFILENISLKNEIVIIIHGIGEGILKNTTHNTLKQNKNVLYFKLDNFNVGVTLVQLKK